MVYRNGKDFILLLKFDEEKRIGISLLSNITRDDASLTNNEYRKMNNSTSGTRDEFRFLLNEN